MLILGALLVNVPYALLITTFDYPDILREPTADILGKFAAGGSRLIWTWLAFAWVGLPILLGILMLPKALAGDKGASRGQLAGHLAGHLAMFFGAAGAVAQMIGLLRWPFVVPVLVRLYTGPEATAATREAVVAVFQAVFATKRTSSTRCLRDCLLPGTRRTGCRPIGPPSWLTWRGCLPATIT